MLTGHSGRDDPRLQIQRRQAVQVESFSILEDRVDLARGAWAASHRLAVRWRGRRILSLSQGPYRHYLYPVFTPAGFAVTSESPADHPHHNSIWVAMDRVRCLFPCSSDETEEGTYNFYVNGTFQWPGAGTDPDHRDRDRRTGSGPFENRVEPRVARSGGMGRIGRTGPPERITDAGRSSRAAGEPDRCPLPSSGRPVGARAGADPPWTLRSAPDRGPDRHPWGHASGLGGPGGRPGDQPRECRLGGRFRDAGTGGPRRRGPVPPLLHGGPPWYVTDWGTLTINPMAGRAWSLEPEQGIEFGLRIAVHDGDAHEARVGELYRAFQEGIEGKRR